MNVLRALACLPWLVACGSSLSPIPPPSPAPAVSDAAEAPRESDPLIEAGFVALGQKNGVTVYRREVLPGIELGAQADIDASPDRVMRVLVDYPNHQKWQEHLAETRILEQGDGFVDVYERLDLPMIDDRDFVLHVTWKKDPPERANAAWRIQFATIAGKGPPPQDGVVRVTSHQGGWVLKPIFGGRATHAIYRFHLDLAGSVPMWMGEGQAADGVVEFFDQVRKQLASYP